MIKTIAGTGTCGYNGDGQLATLAHLNYPNGVHVHNGHVYFSDSYNHRVRMILPNGMIKTIAGTGIGGIGGDGELATESPVGIFVDDSGIYMCFDNDMRIRKVDSNGIITTIIGYHCESHPTDGKERNS